MIRNSRYLVVTGIVLRVPILHPHQVLTRHLPRATHFPPPRVWPAQDWPHSQRGSLPRRLPQGALPPMAKAHLPSPAPSQGHQPLSARALPHPHTRSCARPGDAPPPAPRPRESPTRTAPAARPTARDASDWPARFPRSGPRPKQPPVSRAAPPRGRGHWCSPRAGGHRRDAPNLAFGKGTRARVPETAERRRTEPNRAGETRIRPEESRRPEAAPSAAGTSRARPKGLSRVGRWTGSSPIHGGGGGRCGRRRCSQRPPGPGQLAAV